MTKRAINVVVFDMDETLGHFSPVGLIWDTIQSTCRIHNLTSPTFDDLMKLFPEYQRPGVLKILRYLQGKKEQNICSSIMIYTNNQGPNSWANLICGYFERELGVKLFDRIIRAFKIRGQQIEPMRTSHTKSISDLLSCAQLPAKTQICFIDDQYHNSMDHDKVFYIQIKPYTYCMPYERIAHRLCESDLVSSFTPEAITYLRHTISNLKNIYPEDNSQTTNTELSVDTSVSKRILQHLQSFFKEHGSRFSRRRTARRPHKKKTRKITDSTAN